MTVEVASSKQKIIVRASTGSELISGFNTMDLGMGHNHFIATQGHVAPLPLLRGNQSTIHIMKKGMTKEVGLLLLFVT